MSLAAIGNIGPGFRSLSPFGSYLNVSPMLELLLVFLMWIGGLEIVPVLALVGRPLSEAVPDLPESVVVGAASRNGTLVTPRGDTVLQTGDHLVLFAQATDVEAIVAVI